MIIEKDGINGNECDRPTYDRIIRSHVRSDELQCLRVIHLSS